MCELSLTTIPARGTRGTPCLCAGFGGPASRYCGAVKGKLDVCDSVCLLYLLYLLTAGAAKAETSASWPPQLTHDAPTTIVRRGVTTRCVAPGLSVSLFVSWSKLQAPGSAGCSRPGGPSASSPPQGPVRSGGPCSLRPSRSLFGLGYGFGFGFVRVGFRVRVRVKVRVRATYLSRQWKSVGKPSFSSAT